MKLPKVLVFTVTYEGKDYCFDEFNKTSKKINYPNFRHIFIDNSKEEDYYNLLKSRGLEVYRVGRGANSREAITRGQNFARKLALDEGYDYLFSLESDIMCPPDIIQRLMRHGKDVISGLYYIGDKAKNVRVPCITLAEYNKSIGAWGSRLLHLVEFDDYFKNGIKRVQTAGMGCCLIHKNALKRTAFTYDPRFKGHSDIYFFNSMFLMKIPVFVDTDIICEHDNVSWETVKDR